MGQLSYVPRLESSKLEACSRQRNCTSCCLNRLASLPRNVISVTSHPVFPNCVQFQGRYQGIGRTIPTLITFGARRPYEPRLQESLADQHRRRFIHGPDGFVMEQACRSAITRRATCRRYRWLPDAGADCTHFVRLGTNPTTARTTYRASTASCMRSAKLYTARRRVQTRPTGKRKPIQRVAGE